MRTIVILAAATALTACHATPKAPEGPVMAKEGQWRETITLVSVTGAPKDMPAPPLNQVSKQEKCLKGVKMPDAIWGDATDPHTTVKVDGNHFTAEVPAQTHTDEVSHQNETESVKIDGTFTATHYDLTFSMHMNAGPKAPDLVTSMHIVGDYVGPCPPNETIPIGNDEDSMSAPAANAADAPGTVPGTDGMMNAQ